VIESLGVAPADVARPDDLVAALALGVDAATAAAWLA
jgi:hypothetical protein